MTRIMLKDLKSDDKCWVQAIDTTVFIINKGLLRNNCNMTPYELWKGRPTNHKLQNIWKQMLHQKRR